MRPLPLGPSMLEALEPRLYLSWYFPFTLAVFQRLSAPATVGATLVIPLATGASPSTAVAAHSAATSLPNAPLNIYTRNMTSFTELVIDGTPGNDSILVTQ